MALNDLAYPTLVYIHLLLFGVFLLGQHFRKRHVLFNRSAGKKRIHRFGMVS